MTIGRFVLLGAAALLAALGVFVLRVRPRTAASAPLGIFLTAWGGYFVFVFTPALFDLDLGLRRNGQIFIVLGFAIRCVFVGGLVAMMLTFPRVLPRSDRRLLVIPALFAAAWTAAVVMARGLSPAWEIWLLVGGAIAGYSFVWAYLLLLVSRWRRTADAVGRRQIALTATALALQVSWQVGGYAYQASQLGSAGFALFAAQLAPPVVLAMAWLRATTGTDSRVARNLALLPLAVAFLAFLVGDRIPDYDPQGLFALGTGAILAYAILQHRILGIDVRLRFAISKSTIAAVFIAVFFVASEAAQQFFGDNLGSTYVGIAAAGALVFMMAPLQRAAERLAEKAVPSHPAVREEEGALEVFRRAVQHALRDGQLSRDEEAYLADLATRLGIDYRNALRVRTEVEDEFASLRGSSS